MLSKSILKSKLLRLVILSMAIVLSSCLNSSKLESETDFKERMQWFSDAKYGMFIHFGLYSQLGGVYQNDTIGGYAEWIQANADIPSHEYAKLIQTFNPNNFNADYIVKAAKNAGMKYLVITTKHHEGFCLWDSKYTDFDVASSPFKRDIIAELMTACKRHGIIFGTYYSIIDWNHPSQMRNSEGTDGWSRWGMIKLKEEEKANYILYMKNQIKELIDNYDTQIIWFDGDWVDWWSMETGLDMYNYIRELNPSILINNRVAKRDEFKKDFGTPEQFHLDSVVNYYWEACYTLNDSWGYKKNDTNWKDENEVFKKLLDINAKGGNLLLNIGPDGKGEIPKESMDILINVGMKVSK